MGGTDPTLIGEAAGRERLDPPDLHGDLVVTLSHVEAALIEYVERYGLIDRARSAFQLLGHLDRELLPNFWTDFRLI